MSAARNHRRLPPYLEAALRMLGNNSTPGVVQVEIRHDDTCPLLKGVGACNCKFVAHLVSDSRKPPNPYPNTTGESIMIDFNDIPTNVKKLATGCFLQHLGPAELLALSPPNALAVAENAGLDREEYIAAIEWLVEANRKHADAIHRWNELRRQAQ